MNEIRYFNERNFQFKDFSIIAQIGKGAFSVVYSAVLKKTGQFYALKRVDMVNLGPKSRQNIFKEIQIHKNLIHENIIRFYGSFQY